MRILLIGNYENLRQESMNRFAEMLYHSLRGRGHDVRLVKPTRLLGRIFQGETGLSKWLGYMDRFLIYPYFVLSHQIRWAEIVHICDQANAIYVSRLRAKPHLVTCHDMLEIRCALGDINGRKTRWTGQIYQRWILRWLRRARLLVCVSLQTASELAGITKRDQAEYRIIYNALNYPYQPMPVDEARIHLTSLGLNASLPFFLHVGGNGWYKNRPGTIKLYIELISRTKYSNHNLVMAGKPWTPEMKRIVNDAGLNARVIQLTNVSNEDLRALYTRAEALLFPSLAEGFGWPIVEAQACGCPVVTSNRPPMTEVGGDAAIYIDPDNYKDACNVIESKLAYRGTIVNHGYINAKKFSLPEMTDDYLNAYEDVMRLDTSKNLWRVAR